MRVRSPILVAATALALCSTTASAQESEVLGTASELIRLARFDHAALLGTQLAVQREVEAGRTPKENGECLKGKNHGVLTIPLARFLASEMTAHELRTALQFYSTSAGRKYTQHGIVSFYRNYGFRTDEQLPAISPAEMKEVEFFSKTSAGDKLFFKQLLRTGLKSEEVRAVHSELLRQCRLL